MRITSYVTTLLLGVAVGVMGYSLLSGVRGGHYSVTIPPSGADYAVIQYPDVSSPSGWKTSRFTIQRVVTDNSYFELGNMDDSRVKEVGWIVSLDGREYTLIPVSD